MNHLNRQIAAVAIAASCLAPAFAETNIGVSIDVYQPGIYGQINIGNQPPPRVIYAQPIIYAPPRAVVVQPSPVYLYVPPGHQKHWGKHCGRYNACGRPVYFVQESWVRERYDEQRSHGHGKGHGNGKGHGKGKGDGHH